MTLQALPTVYDLTDPETNLADLALFEGDLDAFVPDFLSQNRFLWGAEIVNPMLGAAYGYQRGRTLWSVLGWALAAYMAPLPVAAIATYEATSGRFAFSGYR